MKQRSLLPFFPFVALALLAVVPACVCSRSSDEAVASGSGQAGAAPASPGAGGAAVTPALPRSRALAVNPGALTVRPSTLRTLKVAPISSGTPAAP